MPYTSAVFLRHLRTRSTAADFVVGHICLVFELVYPISREIVWEQEYLDKLLAFQSENPDIIAWFEYMKRNIWTE